MPLETTAGHAAADSYASLAEADAYHAARGNAAWAALATDLLREQALRRATDYMGQVYAYAWQGKRATAEQALDWPRAGVVVFEVAVSPAIVPPKIRDACAELALKAAATVLAPDLGPAKKRVKVGPLETEYADYQPQSRRYLSVDRMLAPYLAESNPFSIRLERG